MRIHSIIAYLVFITSRLVPVFTRVALAASPANPVVNSAHVDAAGQQVEVCKKKGVRNLISAREVKNDCINKVPDTFSHGILRSAA